MRFSHPTIKFASMNVTSGTACMKRETWNVNALVLSRLPYVCLSRACLGRPSLFIHISQNREYKRVLGLDSEKKGRSSPPWVLTVRCCSHRLQEVIANLSAGTLRENKFDDEFSLYVCPEPVLLKWCNFSSLDYQQWVALSMISNGCRYELVN